MTDYLFSVRALDVPLPPEKQPPGWGADKDHCLCKTEEVGELASLEEALQAAQTWAAEHDHSEHLLYISEWSLDGNGELDECLQSMCLEEWLECQK